VALSLFKQPLSVVGASCGTVRDLSGGDSTHVDPTKPFFYQLPNDVLTRPLTPDMFAKTRAGCTRRG